jgi:hypothetical protein
MRTTKAKHTGGEWEHDEDLNIFGKTGDQYLIAGVHYDDENGCPRNEAEANARLIASAPLMLEALEAVLNMGDDYEAEKLVRKAIAKAKGDKIETQLDLITLEARNDHLLDLLELAINALEAHKDESTLAYIKKEMEAVK